MSEPERPVLRSRWLYVVWVYLAGSISLWLLDVHVEKPAEIFINALSIGVAYLIWRSDTKRYHIQELRCRLYWARDNLKFYEREFPMESDLPTFRDKQENQEKIRSERFKIDQLEKALYEFLFP